MRTKRLKRIAAWLFTGVFLIGTAGCGGEGRDLPLAEQPGSSTEAFMGQPEETAKGRYIEALKETPDGVHVIEDMVRLSDGSVAFLNPDTGDLHVSKDNGDSWESKAVPSLAGIIENEGNEVTSMAIAPDGGIFFSYVNWSGEGSAPAKDEDAGDGGAEDNINVNIVNGDGGKVNEHYVYIDKDGNDSELTLTDESGEYDFYLSQAVFTGNTTLSAQMNGGDVYQIDIAAKSISSVAALEQMYEGGLIMAGGEEVILEEDYAVSLEMLYQFSTGEKTEDSVLGEFLEKETKNYSRLPVCFDKEKNQIYLASSGGLYSHVINGSSMEKLLDAGLCNLGDPTKSAVSVLKNDDGSFLVAYDDGEIDQYTYDKEAPAVPSRQITIYSLKQNMTVSKAVSMFRKSNPDVYVKQEIGLSGDYGVTEEDAIRNLNTRLLAGNGPDILLLDKLPVNSYIEKDVLMDLTEIVGALEQEGSYFSNILKSCETDQGLYAMPFRYRIPVLLGEKGNVEDISDIAGFAESVKKARAAHEKSETVLGTYTPEELLERLYRMFSSSLRDGNKADADAVKEFLAKAAEIYEMEQKNITDEKLQQHNDSIKWRIDENMMDDVENLTVMAGGMFEILGGTQTLMVAQLNGMTDFQMAEGLPKNKEGTAYSLLSSENGKLFIPDGIVGISAQTKEEELAVSFVKELLGEDVQKADLGDGFPVNADAYDKFAENPNPGSTVGFSAATVSEDGETEDMINFSAEWPTKEEVSKMKEQIKTLAVSSLSDSVIYTAVLEVGSKVLTGDLSVEEGCNEIVGKVELYLAE